MSETRSILGLNVDVFPSYQAACDFVRKRVEKRQQTFCVAMNPEKVYRARREPGLRNILLSADMRICDGIGLSLASRILYSRSMPRCTGVDLFIRLLALAERRHWSVYLLGASPESNQGARRELARRFPTLKIAGARDGFFRDAKEVVDDINHSGADLLFVAMGSPRQEFWIAEHRAALEPSFCMGVGGSLDVLAGTARRAPAVFRKTGTEWLFRLMLDPSRLRRQMVLPKFAWEVLKSAFTH
jgi:N-acetylglucosaminyldiphosphoundecaprenol N-acetyl-beta-D-mannosaminyltransferase